MVTGLCKKFVLLLYYGFRTAGEAGRDVLRKEALEFPDSIFIICVILNLFYSKS